jgi:hypothetical protein
MEHLIDGHNGDRLGVLVEAWNAIADLSAMLAIERNRQ